eukprot:TRINITY_DN1198_c0_g1_i1.p1 TRINITY_DN1198_c0_g1~~TRINITY_DN1198_c0_g1_i1.p1  ORF type:complete len:236 (+),score=40.93 TRINITY_DN1198_c0_g1_i1:124-831(+)
MAASSDSWAHEYEEAVRTSDEVATKLGDRKSLLSDGEDAVRAISALRRKLTMLGSKTDRLDALLRTPNLAKLGEKERRRRSELLLELRARLKEMSIVLSSIMPASRAALLGRDERAVAGVVETGETSKLDNRGVLGLQQQVIQDQDEQLQELESTVASTKHIALAINGELDLHTHLLDEIDADVETTRARMKATQKKTMQLSKGSGRTCSLVGFICLAVTIVIIGLIILQLIEIF